MGFHAILESDRRDSHPRPQPWQGCTPPTEPLSHKRVMGIEPTYLAWKASVLPLNYARKRQYLIIQKKSQLQKLFNCEHKNTAILTG